MTDHLGRRARGAAEKAMSFYLSGEDRRRLLSGLRGKGIKLSSILRILKGL
jgi:hypothetical protein